MLSIEEWTKEHIKYITKIQIKRVYDVLDIPCEKLYNTTKNELLLEIQYGKLKKSINKVLETNMIDPLAEETVNEICKSIGLTID